MGGRFDQSVSVGQGILKGYYGLLMLITDLGFCHALDLGECLFDRDRAHGTVHGWQIQRDGLWLGPGREAGDGEYETENDFLHG